MTKPVIVGIINRPPKHSNFIEHYETVLFNLTSDCVGYSLGDVNNCFNNLQQIIIGVTRNNNLISSIIN
jgi:hypothetical protein